MSLVCVCSGSWLETEPVPFLLLDHVSPAGPSEEPAAGEPLSQQAALPLPGVWEAVQHPAGL